MQNNNLGDSDFLLKVFDSLPSPLFVVDSDIRIHHVNTAAIATFGPEGAMILLKQGGEMLHCLHTNDAPGGCGHSDYCRDCIIRNSVSSAFESKKVYRERTRMEVLDGLNSKYLDLLITTSPFIFNGNPYVILVLEDITELNQLRNLLPICSSCKNIRNDAQYWESVEQYFATRHDIKFTHGICPKCAQEFILSYNKKKNQQ